MPSVVVLCPNVRDRLNLADERIMDRFAIRFAGEPIGPGFDPLGFVEHIARFGTDAGGVMGSSDATGHLAAVLAERLKARRPPHRPADVLPRVWFQTVLVADWFGGKAKGRVVPFIDHQYVSIAHAEPVVDGSLRL